MVKKIKIVNVDGNNEINEKQEIEPVEELKPVEPVEETKPVEQIEVKEERPQQEDIKPIEEVPSKEAEPTKTTKQAQYTTCTMCNKQFLTKTYKYSHYKLCLSKNQPPPPPPPPAPSTPEPKAKRARPKEKKETVNPAPTTAKQTFNGVVSFKDFEPVADPYVAMREQRQIIRQQRVKNLISQAL